MELIDNVLTKKILPQKTAERFLFLDVQEISKFYDDKY